MATLREQAHQLIEANKIASCIDFLERHTENKRLVLQLRGEYISGKQSHDFPDRLKASISVLINENTAGDRNFTEFVSKEVHILESYDHINQRNEHNQDLDTDKVLADKSIKHLHQETLQAFLPKERTIIVLERSGNAKTQKQKLNGLALADNEHIYKATLLALGKYEEVNKVCATASQSKFAHFRGTERKNSVPIQTENVDGNLLQQYESVMEFLQNNALLKQNCALDQEQFKKFIEALSEFVANAYVHRDYSARATQTASVEIFDDRIEIKNAGKIPKQIDIHDVQESIPQNPKIMSVFYMSGFVERMGTGINKARNLLREIGLQKAMFELEVDNVVKVTIFYNKPTAT